MNHPGTDDYYDYDGVQYDTFYGPAPGLLEAEELRREAPAAEGTAARRRRKRRDEQPEAGL